jgi:YfiH family protein
VEKTAEVRNCVITVESNGLRYIQFANLKKYDNTITHCFTTRIGGVSTGECASLNLGFNRNDKRENVLENYKRICEVLDIDPGNMVLSNQVHDNKVKVVDYNDRGKGIIRSSDIVGYDGLVTNNKDVALVTFYADCVPLFFFDCEKNVIALAHSGWRGTVKGIAKETLRKMNEEFGCKTGDIEVAIGPSIGKCCFEIGKEVYDEFLDTLGWSKDYCKKTGEVKWHIDLKGIITHMLIDAGVNAQKICNANICTKCNKDVFFSHRGDKGKTGSMTAIMQIKNKGITK